MTARHFRQDWHPDPKPKPEEIAAGMLAHTTSPEAAARVAAFAGRVLGVDVTDDAPARAPAGKGKARPGNTSRKRGMAVEGHYRNKGATAVLAREGYHVQRPRNSEGAADLWAIRMAGTDGPAVRLVQSKRRAGFRADALNEAVYRFLGIDGTHEPLNVAGDTTRESWLWVDRRGWICRAILAADDSLTVSGDDPAVVEAVLTALTRGCERQRAAIAARAPGGAATLAELKERLEGIGQDR